MSDAIDLTSGDVLDTLDGRKGRTARHDMSNDLNQSLDTSKPPSLSSGLAYANRRIDLMRDVLARLCEAPESGPARARLLSELAIVLNDPDV